MKKYIDQTKIMVVMHKKYPVVNNPVLLPIQVNRAFTTHILPIKGDDEGVNISHKNENYCELTAMYWAWKNLHEVEYIGLFHYRRYLIQERHKIFNRVIALLKSIKKRKKWYRNTEHKITSYDDLVKITNETLKKLRMKENTVFLPAEISFGSMTVEQFYFKAHNSNDWQVLASVISDLYPEYISSFHHIANAHSMSPYNMFIMSKRRYNAYCEWLFAILFEVERRIHISTDPYQKRVFGFMAERLFNIYLHKNERIFKKKYMDLAFFHQNAIN